MTSTNSITSDNYGVTSDGHQVTRYSLSNSHGLLVKIIDFGGIITEIHAPNKSGVADDVVLGFDSLRDYEQNQPYFGAIIGRVANRIADAQFTLEGQTYRLFANDGPSCMHGGRVGFNKKLWQSSVQNGKLVLKYVSPDGEENFPGQLTTTVVYSLDDNNNLTLDYSAITTKATIINLTNHSYFNLAGHNGSAVNDHLVTIHAESYLPLKEHSIPTGEVKAVAGTPYDLRSPVRLGDRLNSVPGGIGFDTNYCLEKTGTLKLAARVEDPLSGRYVECSTTEPGLQLYTAFYLSNVAGKKGAVYGRYGAFCLEAQHYPDAIHQPTFPSTVLRPGDTYTQKTIYKFGVV